MESSVQSLALNLQTTWYQTSPSEFWIVIVDSGRENIHYAIRK